MPFPTDASVVVLLGSWWDESTRAGMDATITATPVPAAGSTTPANATPNLTDIANYGWIKSRAWVTKPLASGLYALPLIANDDPDLSAFGGYQINPQGETPFLINVSVSATTMAATEPIVDAVAQAASMSSASFTVTLGQVIQVVRMTEAAVLSNPAPQPPLAFLNEAQINSRIATAVAGVGGGGSGVSDLPEVARTTADSTPANLINKTTGYANTSAVDQLAPPAVPGAVMAVRREVGAAALTLTGATQSGTQDKFGSGSNTSFVYPTDGTVVEWHCTVAGRWRITRGHIAQSVLDARFMPRPDETGAAAGKVPAVTGTNPTAYGLKSIDELVDATPLGPADVGAMPALIPTALKTAAYTAAPGELVVGNATAAGFDVTLPAATAGRVVAVRKADSTGNAIVVKAAGSDMIGLVSPAASVSLATVGTLYLVATAGSWIALASPGGGAARPAPQIDVFTANGTWTKPSTAVKVTCLVIGGGAGGGAGARRASGTATSGGAGGGGGGYTEAVLPASLLGATESVVVGAAGLGAAATTANDSNGAQGGIGGISVFGTTSRARSNNGVGGGGGNTAAATAGAGGSALCAGGGGGAGQIGAIGFAGVRGSISGGGGGAGGGISAAPAAFSGAAGGTALQIGDTGAGTGGGADTAGGVGSSVPTGTAMGGAGGGGGGSSITGAGAAGGNGGIYGAGGGGGGAALNGNNSGKGGDGAPGIVIVISE